MNVKLNLKVRFILRNGETRTLLQMLRENGDRTNLAIESIGRSTTMTWKEKAAASRAWIQRGNARSYGLIEAAKRAVANGECKFYSLKVVRIY